MHTSKNRRRVVTENTGEIITKQYMKDECDINNILNNYKKTGVITHFASRQGEYLDCPSGIDLQAAYDLAASANEMFSELPALVRDAFDNSPRKLLDALRDPGQADRLEQLGVTKRKAPPASGPGSSPVPGSGPIPGPQAAPPQAPGTTPTAPASGAV